MQPRKPLVSHDLPKNYSSYLGYWLNITSGLDWGGVYYRYDLGVADNVMDGLRVFVSASAALEESLWSV